MSGDRATYLDSSALVKLIVAEPETAALRAYLRGRPRLVSCALARVEVVRAVAGGGSAMLAKTHERNAAATPVCEGGVKAAGSGLGAGGPGFAGSQRTVSPCRA